MISRAISPSQFHNSVEVKPAAMLRAFFSLYCLVKNTLSPKVFFRFFKEQNLFFFQKFVPFSGRNWDKINNKYWKRSYVSNSTLTRKEKINKTWLNLRINPSKQTKPRNYGIFMKYFYKLGLKWGQSFHEKWLNCSLFIDKILVFVLFSNKLSVL